MITVLSLHRVLCLKSKNGAEKLSFKCWERVVTWKKADVLELKVIHHLFKQNSDKRTKDSQSWTKNYAKLLKKTEKEKFNKPP